ncbi:hypothetical protein OG453_33295 [Streptomyces sp. NBC_01381]|uniref:hypothetical protein n=1 Tax=Streptomyces sp. NBC_01381 TaxID=2903845 RepID=UPI00224F2C30|nr:hypothetical protein [Streptomyces sp. NBC_01381]MCX4671508.1 hypothetical protein [Streptomyces sp. NBC_01381]
MAVPIEFIARASAQRLTTSARPALADDVEVALHTRGATRHPDQYADLDSLGALIVSVATLAWTVYSDLRSRVSVPQREVIVRHVRDRLAGDDVLPSSLGTAERDQIIVIAVDETFNAAAQHDDPGQPQ